MHNLKEAMSFLKITENLNVSEEFFNDIINIVEELLSEGNYNRQGEEADPRFDKTQITPELRELASKEYPERTLGQAVRRLYKDGKASHSTYSTPGYYQQNSSPNEHTYHVFDVKKVDVNK